MHSRAFITSFAINLLTKGGDSGMTPPELMLSALGCCAMHYAIAYLRARKLALDDIELKVSATKGGQPTRLVEIGMWMRRGSLRGHARA
jgi:uncharacterized OsmC-like protein